MKNNNDNEMKMIMWKLIMMKMKIMKKLMIMAKWRKCNNER